VKLTLSNIRRISAVDRQQTPAISSIGRKSTSLRHEPEHHRDRQLNHHLLPATGDELLYILAGSSSLTVRGPEGEKLRNLRAGDLVVVPKGMLA
jgi:uncharacterized protein YjlB